MGQRGRSHSKHRGGGGGGGHARGAPKPTAPPRQPRHGGAAKPLSQSGSAASLKAPLQRRFSSAVSASEVSVEDTLGTPATPLFDSERLAARVAELEAELDAEKVAAAALRKELAAVGGKGSCVRCRDIAARCAELETQREEDARLRASLERRNAHLLAEMQQLELEVEDVVLQRDSLRACVDGIDALLKKATGGATDLDPHPGNAGMVIGLLATAFNHNHSNFNAASASLGGTTPRGTSGSLPTPRGSTAHQHTQHQLRELRDAFDQLQTRYDRLVESHRSVREENEHLNSSLTELRVMKERTASDLSRVLEDYERLRSGSASATASACSQEPADVGGRGARTPEECEGRDTPRDDITTEADSSPLDARLSSSHTTPRCDAKDPPRAAGILRFFGR